MPENITQFIDGAYEDIQNFELNPIFRCNNRDFIRCTAVFVPGDLAIVYVKSPDAKHIEGAIIISDTFSGIRGNITESDVKWASQYHQDITINTEL